jgi:hypothetical protein
MCLCCRSFSSWTDVYHSAWRAEKATLSSIAIHSETGFLPGLVARLTRMVYIEHSFLHYIAMVVKDDPWSYDARNTSPHQTLLAPEPAARQRLDRRAARPGAARTTARQPNFGHCARAWRAWRVLGCHHPHHAAPRRADARADQQLRRVARVVRRPPDRLVCAAGRRDQPDGDRAQLLRETPHLRRVRRPGWSQRSLSMGSWP